jgi:hypothetical protein
MGATFDYRVYNSDNKHDMQMSWIKDQAHALEQYIDDYIEENDASYDEAMENIGYSGEINTLGEKIDWVYVPAFDSEREAADYIESKHKKWENPLGVPFMNGENINYAVGGWCSI